MLYEVITTDSTASLLAMIMPSGRPIIRETMTEPVTSASVIIAIFQRPRPPINSSMADIITPIHHLRVSRQAVKPTARIKTGQGIHRSYNFV